MLNKYRYIIFDLDGTISKLHINWSGWHRGVSKIIHKYESEAILPNFITHSMTNEYMVKYGEPIREEIKEYTEKVELSTYSGMSPNLKAIKFISELSQNQKVILLTSNCRKIVDHVLQELKLDNTFDLVITRDDVDFLKPDKFPFTLINKSDIPKTQYIMIGDTSSDSDFAKNVGIDYLDVAEIT